MSGAADPISPHSARVVENFLRSNSELVVRTAPATNGGAAAPDPRSLGLAPVGPRPGHAALHPTLWSQIESRAGENFAEQGEPDGGAAAPNVLEMELNVATGSARQSNGIYGMDEYGPGMRALKVRVSKNRAEGGSEQKNVVLTAEMTRIVYGNGGNGI